MSTRHRMIMVGAGGMAGNWVRRFLPPFRDRLEIVALVDVDRAVLDSAADAAGLPANARFTDVHAAMERADADCCGIAIPPTYHKEAVVAAVSRGLHVLSEKPIADTWEATVDIYRAVQQAGVKMEVIQNYRYTRRIATFKQVLTEGRVGQLHSLAGRFAADYRRPNAWGAPFRHEMRHALLIEGGIHHLDQLRNLSNADCATIAGWEWNPGVASFRGECQGLFVAFMTNNVRAQYEGNCAAAGWQNSWRDEYYRAECANGAVVLDRDNVVRIQEQTAGGSLRIEEVPPVRLPWEEHQMLVSQFIDWLDGGPTPPTVITENIKSAAMLFGAIKASATNQTVDVGAMVAAAAG